MPNIIRVPITNVHVNGEYTAQILVGARQTPVDVILDTGSSVLAIDAGKYAPDVAGGDVTTRLAQTAGYGDKSSWTGAVITTQVGLAGAALPAVSAAIAYEASANIFGSAGGILGLAWAALDEAFAMAADTWASQYPNAEVLQGEKTPVAPYRTALSARHALPDIVAFSVRRALTHQGAGGAADPLNQGWMILGGGAEAADLYAGPFQTAKVMADEWWNVHLKAVIVGGGPIINIPARGLKGVPSNALVDTGNPSLVLGPTLLATLLGQFSPAQQAQLRAGIAGPIAMADLDLAAWPALIFVLEGEAGDLPLAVVAGDYWQVNAPAPGQARLAVTAGVDGLTILGLPLMAGWFTVFDGEAAGGRGVIRFARRAG
jgi:hypothetical protein